MRSDSKTTSSAKAHVELAKHHAKALKSSLDIFAPGAFKLSDCQALIAKMTGCRDWHHLETISTMPVPLDGSLSAEALEERRSQHETILKEALGNANILYAFPDSICYGIVTALQPTSGERPHSLRVDPKDEIMVDGDFISPIVSDELYEGRLPLLVGPANDMTDQALEYIDDGQGDRAREILVAALNIDPHCIEGNYTWALLQEDDDVKLKFLHRACWEAQGKFLRAYAAWTQARESKDDFWKHFGARPFIRVHHGLYCTLLEAADKANTKELHDQMLDEAKKVRSAIELTVPAIILGRFFEQDSTGTAPAFDL